MSTYRSQELLRQGHDYNSIQSAARAGELTRIRHGGYATETPARYPSERHRLLIATTLPLLRPDTTLSHGSAGVLWGLPVPDHLLNRVHITRDRFSGGRRDRWLHTHVRALPPSDRTQIQGQCVTSLARTAVDLSRLCDRQSALAVMDAAWRLLASPDELRDQLDQARARTGIRAARWALGHANPLAESPGESFSRYLMITHGLPMPLLQYEVYDQQGNFAGRADFAWEELRVLGEFDGRVKYQRDLLRPGQTPEDVVMAEKRRENGFRALDWWVYRWVNSDLADGTAFARRLAAFLEHRRTT